MKRCLVLVTLLAATFAVAAPVNAQTIGTFRWNVAPFCSVLNMTVVQEGGVFTLTGFEEQCGDNPRLPVYGTAILQADGTITLGLTTIFPGGDDLHTYATLSSNFSGTWRDSAGSQGAFVFSPGATTGPPRHLGTLDRVPAK